MAELSFPMIAPPAHRPEGWARALRPAFGHLVRHAILGLAFSLSLGCVLALLLRLTCKDSLPALAPLFYATPLALIWSGLCLASGMFFVLRKPKWAIAAAMASCTCWAGWQQTNMRAAPPLPSDDSIPVVFWNTARLKYGWDAVARQMQAHSAPLMGFVEAGPDDDKSRTRWELAFPDHQRIFFGNGMVLLIEGTVFETDQGVLGRGSYFGRAVLESKGQRLTVFLVDIHSNPFLSREDTLARLTDLALATPGPVLIMGDFNTPSDSVHFTDLRAGFQNAFEAGGSGNLATWPVPCPVLAIDHIWTNRHIRVRSARHEGSPQSDHQAVLAKLSFSESSSRNQPFRAESRTRSEPGVTF